MDRGLSEPTPQWEFDNAQLVADVDEYKRRTGVPFRDMFAEIGVDDGVLAKMRNGPHTPSTLHLLKLCRLLDVDPRKYLVDRTAATALSHHLTSAWYSPIQQESDSQPE